MTFPDYLSDHLARFPKMRPEDVFKLCYQAARGAEHLLRDPDAARRYFDAEWEATPSRSAPLSLPLSDGFCRVDLGAWKAAGLSPDHLFSLFVMTAEQKAEEDTLPLLLQQADACFHEGNAPFSLAEWETALAAYRKAGAPPVHHSDAYRNAYAPAYRVVGRALLRVLPILAAIEERRPHHAPLILSIDGRAASGKSTLADTLARLLGASVIRMDDFFLPPPLRTPARLSEAGGNIHYERFWEEILPFLSDPAPFSYGVFDCGTMSITHRRTVEDAPIRIVEGSYAQHPIFGDYAHLKVFSTVDEEEQLTRIVKRNGHTLAARFRAEWIPMEESYFQAFCIPTSAHIRV